LIAWQQDHKRMAEDNKALTTLASNSDTIAAEVITTLLDFISRELYLLNEVKAGKVSASLNQSNIDGLKEMFCQQIQRIWTN
jgi:hypothetical protein